MPVTPGRKTKLQATIDKVKASGWRSTNEFVEAFYSEPTSAAQTISYESRPTLASKNLRKLTLASSHLLVDGVDGIIDVLPAAFSPGEKLIS
jgi:hypothetical protein